MDSSKFNGPRNKAIKGPDLLARANDFRTPSSHRTSPETDRSRRIHQRKKRADPRKVARASAAQLTFIVIGSILTAIVLPEQISRAEAK